MNKRIRFLTAAAAIAEHANRPDTRAATTPVRCVDEQGFSLHAEVCCAAHEPHKLEHLCRYITRPAITNERLTLNRAWQLVLTLKTPFESALDAPR